jgi:predicted N-acetyltransferase YhbS
MTLVERRLRRDEFGALAAIDRSEAIDGHYELVDGSLRLVPTLVDAPGWSPSQVTGYVTRLHDVHDAGGVVVGAWDGATLVGLAALDVRPVGGDPHLLDLDFLHVSRAHRGHGVARRLVAMLAEHASALGATALYVSATPTRNTVDAYLRLGARLADPPDPVLLAREPDDIHLVLPL